MIENRGISRSSSCRFSRGMSTAARATSPPIQAAIASTCPAVAMIFTNCQLPPTASDWVTMVAAITITRTTVTTRRQPTIAPPHDVDEVEADAGQRGQPYDRRRAVQRGEDVADRATGEEDLDQRAGYRADDHQPGADRGQRDQPAVRASLRPDQSPEGEGAGQQHVSRVADDPVQPERQLQQLRAEQDDRGHCGLGRLSWTSTTSLAPGEVVVDPQLGRAAGGARLLGQPQAGADQVEHCPADHADPHRQVRRHAGADRGEHRDGPPGD